MQTLGKQNPVLIRLIKAIITKKTINDVKVRFLMVSLTKARDSLFF